MNKQNILLNILTFKASDKPLQFSFFKEKSNEQRPLRRFEFPFTLWENYEEELKDYKRLYCNFVPDDVNADFLAEVDLNRSTNFGIHYFNHLIRNYFNSIADAIFPNFIDDTEVWFFSEKKSDTNFTAYSKYTIKVQHAKVSNRYELVISFDGTSKTFNKSVADLQNIDPDLFSWVKLNNSLIKFEYLTPDQKQHIEKLFPVLNNKLRTKLKIPYPKPNGKNKYIPTRNRIHTFYNDYLNTLEFKQLIPLDKEGFLSAPDDRIFKVNHGSNSLLFYDDKTEIDPFIGMRDFGPYKAPDNGSASVRFFFIYPKDLRNTTVKKLFEIFRDGLHYEDKYNPGIYKMAFPSLNKYIRQPFYMDDKEGSVPFDSLATVYDQVLEKVRNKPKNYRYFALYISPVSRDTASPEDKEVYFKLKELLLEYGISSQVIYKNRVNEKAFRYHLPNIATAILAKLGGIPWRLNRDAKADLIVGVGAFYSTTQKHRYIGSAFCFNNEGDFKEFDSFPADEIDMLAGSIRKAVMRYIVENESAERLIIHFYKRISEKELRPIIQTLHRLGVKIPVFILTINKTESKDLVAFDTDSSELMPMSGTIIQTGPKQYLLCNNTRYSKSSERIKDFPFPVKIEITATEEHLLSDILTIKELLDQVYQFSRMYWKSVKQQNLPVTIKYPEMVAEIFPHFNSPVLPPYARESLWFL